jgi:hypothetical protein
MKQLVALMWLILVIGACSCDRGFTGPRHSVLGEYQLSAYDNSGRVAFTGTIVLTTLEQDHLKGRCAIVREKNAPEGLLDQNSECEGLIDGDEVNIDTAPFLDDAGLLLEGQFGDDRITGSWRIDGFVTSEVLGKFEAVQKK